MPFNELLEEADRLAGVGEFGEALVCQGGQSTFRMAHAEQFVGRPSIDDLIAKSSLVITHGGATVIQLLLTRKSFVAFPNPRAAGGHQMSFLEHLGSISDISWSGDVQDLARLFRERRSLGPASVRTDFPRAADIVRGVLKPAAPSSGHVGTAHEAGQRLQPLRKRSGNIPNQ